MEINSANFKKEGIMRFKISIILFAFLCGTVLFMFCGRDAEEPNYRPENWNQSVDDIVKIIELQPGADLSEEKKSELAGLIIAARDEFIATFENDDFTSMGGRMGNRGTRILVVNNEPRFIFGARELAVYFQTVKLGKEDEWQRDATIEFKFKSVTVSPITPARNVWSNSDQKSLDSIDMYIRITFGYHIVPVNSKEKIENEAGGGDMGCYHRQGCQLIC
jgi:hypothetical protein